MSSVKKESITGIVVCCIVLAAAIAGVCIDFVGYKTDMGTEYYTLTGKSDGIDMGAWWNSLNNVGFLKLASYGVVALAAIILAIQIPLAIVNIFVYKQPFNQQCAQRTAAKFLYLFITVFHYLLIFFGIFVLLSVYLFLSPHIKADGSFICYIGSWIVAACGIIGGITTLLMSRSFYGKYREGNWSKFATSMIIMVVVIIGMATDFLVYERYGVTLYCNIKYVFDLDPSSMIGDILPKILTVYASIPAVLAGMILQAVCAFCINEYTSRKIVILMNVLFVISGLFLVVECVALGFVGLETLPGGNYWSCTIGYYLVLIGLFASLCNSGVSFVYGYRGYRKPQKYQENNEKN